MRNAIKTLGSCLPVLVLCLSCLTNSKSNELVISVINQLNFDRTEIVALSKEELNTLLKNHPEAHIKIKNEGAEDYLLTQWVDENQDGVNDKLLFQAKVSANSEEEYVVVVDSVGQEQPTSIVAYSRFVPERTDDYTWENDKVAFRTYGPEAQRLVENDEPGGTLSSGIDLWLKKVDYSIIDKWYARNIEEVGYYHIDHGEGYDPYHVGKSRGTGGTGVWENDSLLVSKNFFAYRTIAAGPLRTIFELDYASWSPQSIKETKRISLDLGSNFSKFKIHLSAETPIDNYTIGITLHEKEGNVSMNQDQGWFSHWEPIDDTFLGEGIVIDSEIVKEAFVHESSTPDQSQLFVITTPQKNRITYYAGFGWTKSGQVSSVHDWETMLQKQVQIIKNPLQVTLK